MSLRLLLTICSCYYSNFRGPRAAKIFTKVMIKYYPRFKIEIRVLRGGWSLWKNQFKSDPRLVDLTNSKDEIESDEDEEQQRRIGDQNPI
jgi:hypothetical protein